MIVALAKQMARDMDGQDHQEPWTPDPLFPADPEFYRRVLHYLPSPVVVVDNAGDITYVNHAMQLLGGWDLDEMDINRSILSHIHPEDRDALTASFMQIAASPGARILGSRSWAEIYFRIIANDGTVIPIELVGAGGLLDMAVQGIIYEVRPARARNLLGRVLDGLSQGASVHQLLSLVIEMITMAPLDLEATILQSTDDGDYIVVSSSRPVPSTQSVHDIVESVPWSDSPNPQAIPLSELNPRLAERFSRRGYHSLWQVCVASPLTSTRLRIFATSPTNHVPDNGPRNRLVRARELAAAVLLRSQSEAMFEHAADHDRLTELPNRAAFYLQLDRSDPTAQKAAIHIDLDGITRINTAHGVGAGDAVLQVVADRVRSLCVNEELIGRVGDDEFVVVMISNKIESVLEQMAMDLAARMQTAASETIIVAGRPIQTSASIGVAIAGPETPGDELLTWADSALRTAKRAGGGQIALHHR